MAMRSTIKNELKGVFDNRYVAWGLIIGCGWLGVKLVNKGFAAGGAVNKFVDDQVDKAKVKNQNPGSTNDDYNRAYAIANSVSIALGTKKGTGWLSTLTEDEEKAAYDLNKISSQLEANLVKDIYRNLTGRDLWYDINDLFHNYQIAWINQNVQSWIK